jgi:HK97 family phage portal protein
MGLFTRRSRAEAPALPPAKPARLRRADEELVSLAEMNGINQAIEHAISKVLGGGVFGDENQGSEGGYFGPEFDIRATASRIKPLYAREPWIFSAATHMARTLSVIPLKVFPKGSDEEVDPNHPLAMLINSGSDVQDALELRWVGSLDLALGGNGFLILDESLKKIVGIAPVELVTLRFDETTKRVTGIEVAPVSGQTSARGQFFKIEHVVHHRLPNPYSPFYGFSPFTAAARPILLDRFKNEFELAFYLRGASVTGVIESTEDLSKSRLQRLMRTFEATFTGRANWWRTLFLPKGAKWTKAGLTMAEMQHLEGMKENRKTILAVLGIPPSMVGLIEDVNRATADQQERIFYNNTIVPMANFMAAGWNSSHLLKVVHKGKFEVRPDFSSIPAVDGSVSDKKEQADAMAPYFTIDEIRSWVWGEKPLPTGQGNQLVAQVRGGGAAGDEGGDLDGLTERIDALPRAGEGRVKAELPEGHDIQCLLFLKASFTEPQARAWAKEHGYGSDPCEEAQDHWRITQIAYDLFFPDSIHTVELGGGVSAVVGERKEGSARAQRHEQRKAAATGSQNRVERRLSEDFQKAYDTYIDAMLGQVVEAVKQRREVRGVLLAGLETRQRVYLDGVVPTMERAMDRGFTLAAATVKTSAGYQTKTGSQGLSDSDIQALEILRERTRDGQRKVLHQRGISAFQGLDANRTEAVMNLIEQGMKDGLGWDAIAGGIRARYEEAYPNQARTIVRTEILSAVSHGINWNHDTLGKVFTEVRKQWLHQGDAGINPDAREEHAGFEALGEVPTAHVWTAEDGSQLAYPRDPGGSAGQIVNCRCTMISVIPDTAISNADAILETD